MIYLDSSVALAHLLTEERRPPDSLWAEPLVSSRLLEFELLNVLRVGGFLRSHEALARELLSRIGLLEAIPEVITFSKLGSAKTRTLDALHLASALFLLEHGADVRLASYDARMLQGARELRIPALPL